MYYTKIDQYFNNRKLGWGFNDKNYYSKIFDGVKQPAVIVRKINGFILDAAYGLLTKEQAFQLIGKETEVVCKPALETGSGRGVCFWNLLKDKKSIASFLDDPEQKDFIVQRSITQHPELSRVYADSINTLRLVSLLMPEGVHLLSSNLRMGTGGGRIDNVSAGGIHPNGALKRFASDCYTGVMTECHA